MIDYPGWIPLKHHIRLETRLLSSLPADSPLRPPVIASLEAFRVRLAADPAEQAVNLRHHCPCCGRARDDLHTAECPRG